MLALHPGDERVSKICTDFDDDSFFETLPQKNYELIISSSSLQWSRDIDRLLGGLSRIGESCALAVFTSATFGALHEFTGLKSPVCERKTIEESIRKQLGAECGVSDYRMYFESTREMLRYIKRSGTSGGMKKLSYSELRRVISLYPHDFLDFEVLFASTES
jgi:malonyl-CoA O-methyltransferase